MTEVIDTTNTTYSRDEVFLVRRSQINHSLGNYVFKKGVENVAAKANLVLRTTGTLGSNPISIPKEQEKAKARRKMLCLTDVVEDSQTNVSYVCRLFSNQDIRGPYTVREMEPARIQKIIYQGREIFFGITKQNHLVMYSVIKQKGERQMIVHAPIEKIDASQNNTAYLKNKAKQTLLELIKRDYDFYPLRTELVAVREAA